MLITTLDSQQQAATPEQYLFCLICEVGAILLKGGQFVGAAAATASRGSANSLL